MTAAAKRTPATNPAVRTRTPALKIVSLDDQDRRGGPPAEEPLQLTPELLEEIERKREEFENADPQEILRWAVRRFAPRLTMTAATMLAVT